MKVNLFNNKSNHSEFIERSIIVSMIGVISLFFCLIFWKLSIFIPLIFATVIIAIAWHSLAKFIHLGLKIPQSASVLAVAIGLIFIMSVGMKIFGNQILSQYDEIALDIPTAISLIQTFIEEHPWGQFLENLFLEIDYSKAATPVAQSFSSALSSLVNGLTLALFAMIGAAYLAANPKKHIEAVISLTPISGRENMLQFLNKSGSSLRQWLLLQFYVVAINTLFAGVALWGFHVPAALALATISGSLAFIPYFGSIIAIAIGALVALPHGVNTSILAALAIGAASAIEGYVITPYLQSQSLSIPAVMLLFCMLAFGAIYGAMGIVIAVPATVVLSVAYTVFIKQDESD